MNTQACQKCGAKNCAWHSKRSRILKDLHANMLDIEIDVYRCRRCGRFFCVPPSNALKGCHYTIDVIRKTLELFEDKNMRIATACKIMSVEYGVYIPRATISDWKNMM